MNRALGSAGRLCSTQYGRHTGLGTSVKEGVRDVEEYLNAADAGLYASESESFGLSILETLFHAKPVVAFRVGGIPEVVVDGENGFLHPFGETDALARSIERLADSPELAREMGVRGRERADKLFTADQIVPQYRALYRRALRGTGADAA